MECAYQDGGELQKGKLIYMTYTDSQFGPGPIYRARYNARDQHEVEVEEYDFDHDGTIDTYRYTRYNYNAEGLLVEQVFEHDYDANGSVDYNFAAKGTYDAKHRLTEPGQGLL
jgi:YD repeat-containing protein